MQAHSLLPGVKTSPPPSSVPTPGETPHLGVGQAGQVGRWGRDNLTSCPCHLPPHLGEKAKASFPLLCWNRRGTLGGFGGGPGLAGQGMNNFNFAAAVALPACMFLMLCLLLFVPFSRLLSLLSVFLSPARLSNISCLPSNICTISLPLYLCLFLTLSLSLFASLGGHTPTSHTCTL